MEPTQTNPEMENVEASTAPATQPVTGNTAEEEAKKQALLAWLVAPFYSYPLKKSDSEFVRSHAEASFYYGVSALVLIGLMFVINFILWNLLAPIIVGGNPFSAFSLASSFGVVSSLMNIVVFLYVVVPRVYGIVKAQNMEVWEVPKVKSWVSKYLKF